MCRCRKTRRIEERSRHAFQFSFYRQGAFVMNEPRAMSSQFACFLVIILLASAGVAITMLPHLQAYSNLVSWTMRLFK